MLLAASSWLDVLLNGVYIAAALLVAAAVIAIVQRRLRRGETVSANEQLAQYRALYESGAISQQEFERLRGVLGGIIHQEVKAANPQGPGGHPAMSPAEKTDPPQAKGPTSSMDIRPE
jgi:hypothetical protein